MVRAALATATALAVLPLSVADAKPSYTTTPGPNQSQARFVVTYKGSGAYKTRFHATPPNPDGKPDTNDAWDSSKQDWSIKFQKAATVPTCGPPASGFGDDPCASLTGLSGAKGPTSLSGHVDHRHIDGLYRVLNRKVKCEMRKRPSKKRLLDASIGLRYIPETQSIGVSASDPIATAVSLFPAQCPEQGDSIDRILDFYAMPGFSFAESYGPERWFASKEVIVPAAVFHKSSKIRIPLHDTAAGRPPKHCALHDPSFERCTTGGSWHGVLTLTAKEK
ncbi:MAG: hypothetical protein QOH76_2488 [Thermoleophilaceae bacterium]|jgi:hypothetical protein|nr:hypothetical protein [Thermoleophilaceae bacterium]